MSFRIASFAGACCILAATAVPARAQQASISESAGRIRPFVSAGGSQGYGGYDYFGRSAASFGVGVDIMLRPVGPGLLTLGGDYINRVYGEYADAICLTATRRPCMVAFPQFNSASVALSWRLPVKGFISAASIRSSIVSAQGRRTPSRYLAPGAGLSIGHHAWGPLGIFVSTTGTFLSSVDDQRLLLHETAVGLRLW